jgi:uncharacterized protein
MAASQGLYTMTVLAALCFAQQRGSPMIMFENDKSFPSIAVTGTGKISARPDVADVQVGVMTQSATAKEAVEANDRMMDRLHAIVSERGVANKDIRTAQFEISPVYSEPQSTRAGAPVQPPPTEFVPRIVAYRVKSAVHITARQIDKLGQLLDATVQGGANQITGITFRIDRAEQLLDEARKRAVTDAKRKAELLAGECGMVVGIPWKIEEDASSGSRLMGEPLAHILVAPPAAPSMPISAGEEELSVTVSILYELKNPK